MARGKGVDEGRGEQHSCWARRCGHPLPAKRESVDMLPRTITKIGLAAMAAVLATAFAAEAGDAASCKKVRFSDVGWTDITATTALTSRVLTGLGYEPSATILAVP